MPDLTSRIRFRFFFSLFFFLFFFKEGMNHIFFRNDPDPIWMAWSGFGQTHLVWKQAGVHLEGFWQDATGPLPVSHFQTRFRSSTYVLVDIVQNQPGYDLVLAECVRFWPNGSGPEPSRCAKIIRPASGQCFAANPDQMQIGSGMFTGYTQR